MLEAGQEVVLSREGLDRLLQALARDYRVIGPTVRDGAIVYDDIAGVADLPAGWTDEQDGGHYRLRAARRRGAVRLRRRPAFVEAFPPSAASSGCGRPRAAMDGGLDDAGRAGAGAPFAFIGVRSCELHAIAIQDRVFLEGPYVDPHYQARRAATLSSSRSTAARPAAPASASRWTPARGRSRASTSRSPSSSTASGTLPGRGRQRAGRRGAGRGAARARRRAEDRAARASSRRAHRRQHGPRRWTPTTSRSCCCATSSIRAGTRWPSAAWPAATARWSARPASAPRSRTSPTSPARAPSACGAGTPASPRTSPTSTAAACGSANRSRYRQWMTHKLAHLDRPVRHLGLRRLRPLHHLVPGRHRHHRRGRAAIRGERPARQEMAMMEGSTAILAEHPFFAGLARPHSASWSPAAPGTCASTPAQYLFREGEPADDFYLSATAGWRSRSPCRGAAGRASRRSDEGEIVGVSWLVPPYRWTLRRPGARADARHRARRQVPARQVRGGPRPRLRADEALRAGAGPSACRRPACRCSTSMDA